MNRLQESAVEDLATAYGRVAVVGEVDLDLVVSDGEAIVNAVAFPARAVSILPSGRVVETGKDRSIDWETR